MAKYLIFLFLCLQNTFFLNAQTHVEGIIKENMTLTEKGSPYTIGKTVIAEGVVLTIEAGVEITIKFQNPQADVLEYPNDFTLVVKGTIVAHGTQEKPIQIDGAIDIKANFNILATSVFEYCYLHHRITDNVLTAQTSLTINNSTVEGGIYVTMPTNGGWNPWKLNLYQCKLSADDIVLSVSFGSVRISDCEINGRCILRSHESLDIDDTDFRQGVVKHPYALLLNSRATLHYNSFEGIDGAAILVYYKPKNVISIWQNVFRNNKNHIEIDLQTASTTVKDISKWDNYLEIGENDFLNATEHKILVTDEDHSSDRVQAYRSLDIKENYWGKVFTDAVAKSIHDNEDDDKIRVKLNFMPIKKDPYFTPKPSDAIKQPTNLIFTDTIDPLSILTFTFGCKS